jgi:RNA polymerase sigma-70 factor (sigma-E family)
MITPEQMGGEERCWPSSTARLQPGDPAVEFEAFFERHHRDLGRLAYLVTGDQCAADDLSADVLLDVWRQWDRVRAAESPLAYARRMTINQAASRVRRLTSERRRMRLFQVDALAPAQGQDGEATVDVRRALQALPERRRACVVLRYAMDLSEQEVAQILGISVGTVKSQTSKATAALQRLLGEYVGGGKL